MITVDMENLPQDDDEQVMMMMLDDDDDDDVYCGFFSGHDVAFCSYGSVIVAEGTMPPANQSGHAIISHWRMLFSMNTVLLSWRIAEEGVTLKA